MEGTKTTLLSSSDYSGKKENSYKNKAVSVKDENNWFWALKEEKFFGKGHHQSAEGVGKDGSSNSIFKDLYGKKTLQKLKKKL